jgi:hypothetical protein
MAMVTGKVATVELEEATRPTDVTVPYTAVVEFSGVITAWSPTLTWPTWVSSTVVLTVYEFVEMTVIWAEVDDEEEELLEAVDGTADVADPPNSLDPELLDPAPEAPEDEDVPDPVTSSPTARPTDATVPAIVEVRLASARLVCAVVRLVCAVVTDA